MIPPAKPLKLRNPTLALQKFVRLLAGLGLGVSVYYVAQSFASVDCQAIQAANRAGGLRSVVSFIGLMTLLISLGVPAAIIGTLAGLLLSPPIGAPLASFSVVLATAVFWGLGRLTHLSPALKKRFLSRLENMKWFNEMMDNKASSGFHWTVSASLNSPISYPLFAFFAGLTVSHLRFAALITGIFASSALYIAGYALAGGSIGCGVVNHAINQPFEQYKPMMLLSCALLLMLSKAQSALQQKGNL